MKKALIVLAVLLAAIMPLFAQEAKTTFYRFEAVKLFELDAKNAQIDGSRGSWVKQNLGAIIRSAMSDTDLVQFAVTGDQYRSVVASQDRVQSGRYRASSQELVPVGQMIAPTDQCHVSGNASVVNEDYGTRGIAALVDIFSSKHSRRSQRSLSPSVSQKVARVSLQFEVYDNATGVSTGMYTAEGKAADFPDISYSGGRSNRQPVGSYGYAGSQQDPFWKATQDAIRKLKDKFAREFVPEKVCDGIDVVSGKSVDQKGTVITFYRNDRQIAEYEVLSNKGNTLFVRILTQVSLPGEGDPFKISQ